jgi:hypothetical protein
MANEELPSADLVNGSIFSSEYPETSSKLLVFEKLLPGQTAFYKAADVTHMARLYVPDLSRLVKNSVNKKLFEQISDQNGYIDFLLSSVTEQQRERVQVFETVGDEYAAYFFGKTPPVFIFTGQLYNVKQNNWRHAFLQLYSELLRGTKLQRYYRYVTVYYDRIYVIGSMISMSTEIRAESQMIGAFTFELLVKKMMLMDRAEDFKPSKIPLGPGIKLTGSGQTVSYTGSTSVNIERAKE